MHEVHMELQWEYVLEYEAQQVLLQLEQRVVVHGILEQGILGLDVPLGDLRLAYVDVLLGELQLEQGELGVQKC